MATYNGKDRTNRREQDILQDNAYQTYQQDLQGAKNAYNTGARNQTAVGKSGYSAAPTFNWNGTAPGEFNYSAAMPTFGYASAPGAFSYNGAKPGDWSYKDAPTYTNAYKEQIDQMVNGILNRDKFSYDYTKDPLYTQYANAYTRNGIQAMKDTYAQQAARTGGLASSYAGAAAQQQYDQYMQALNDKIPELYQLAYSMYQDEGNTMRNNLQMVQGLENTDYGRYMDQLGQYNTDRNLSFNQWQEQMNQYNTDRNFAHSVYQDQLDQYNADRNMAYKLYQDQMDQYNSDKAYAYENWKNSVDQYNTDYQKAYGDYLQQVNQYNNAQQKASQDAYLNSYKNATDEYKKASEEYQKWLDQYNQALEDSKGRTQYRNRGIEGGMNDIRSNDPGLLINEAAAGGNSPLSNGGAVTFMMNGYQWNGQTYKTKADLEDAILKMNKNRGYTPGEEEKIKEAIDKYGLDIKLN